MSDKKIRALVKTDRCDKCRAAAIIALLFKNNHELMFCNHCFAALSDSLKEADPLIVGADEKLMVVVVK